jgi:WD40 repeat protein
MDAVRHHLLRRREIFTHPANLRAVAISGDGKRLATADYEGRARLWDIDSGEVLAERKLATRALAAHVESDGTAVFATAIGATISLETLPAVEAESGSRPTIDNTQDVASAAFSADGSMLVTGGQSSGPAKARLWRVTDGKLLAELPHPRSIERVVFRPHHEALATVCSDGQMRLWTSPAARRCGN